MMLSRMNQLSFRLPALVAVVILIVATSLSVLTFLNTRTEAVAQVEKHLLTLTKDRAMALRLAMEHTERQVRATAGSPSVMQALRDLNVGWGLLDPAQRAQVRLDYTSLNPNAPDRRSELSRAPGDAPYHDAHERQHPYLNHIRTSYNLYDLFLINRDGDIVYSATKEDDFGRSVTSGALATSGIGQAFARLGSAATDEVVLTRFEPYAASGGSLASFAAMRLSGPSGDMEGALVFQVNSSKVAELLRDVGNVADKIQLLIVDPQGRLLLHEDADISGNGPAGIAIADHIRAALQGQSVAVSNVTGHEGNPVTAAAMPIRFGTVTYALVAEKPQDVLLAPIYAMRDRAALITVAAVVIMSLLAWLYIRTITRALDRIGKQMTRISDGDFAVDVTDSRRRDELGDIGRRLVDFRGRLELAAEQEAARKAAQVEQQLVIEELGAGLVRLAEGDLSQPILREFDPQYDSLRTHYNETLRTLSGVINDVKEAAGSITHGAAEISQASDDLSNRTENQAATLEETAAALDELTASVKSAADGAKSVETIVIEAQSEAEQSGKIVGNAIAAMTEIEKSSEHISQIIGVIDDIAFQTNLLALNAGVEAARAGEAGKGFAVVASEVRALAQRSSEAAKEIKTLISGSARQVEHGVDLVGGAGKALGTIVQRVTHISELIRAMAKGTSEQAIGLGEINIGVNQLDQVTQQNAAMVEQATAASHVLRRDAERLRDLVSRFETGLAAASDVGANGSQPAQFQISKNPRSTPAPAPIPLQGASFKRPKAAAGGDWVDF